MWLIMQCLVPILQHAERVLWCIQRSINLSLQQKKELLAGRHYYLTKLSEVLQQRESLLATLEVTNFMCPGINVVAVFTGMLFLLSAFT